MVAALAVEPLLELLLDDDVCPLTMAVRSAISFSTSLCSDDALELVVDELELDELVSNRLIRSLPPPPP